MIRPGGVAAARHVLFDFDHTLGKDNRLEERVLLELAALYCPRVPSPVEITDALAEFRSGDISLDEMVEDAIADWGGKRHRDAPDEYRARCLALVPASVEATPGAKQLYDWLAERGVRHAILTNGWTELQLSKAAAAGYPGRVMTSQEIGYWKPDARAFRHACDALDFEIASTLYVGDSPEADVAGSKAAGLIACWADLDGRAYPTLLPAPDHTITKLSDLPRLLEDP
ncbi:MAG TPA: HAD family hydrolase [Candidatus Eremiobacteraceae bacterium]|nr:HAD family hydrolase [Candidatus Eremiobacteraceae bacterium]